MAEGVEVTSAAADGERGCTMRAAPLRPHPAMLERSMRLRAPPARGGAMSSETEAVATLNRHAVSLSDGEWTAADVTAIVDRIGDARIVLVGEASHGTHEFYDLRAAVTRRLIETRGFRAVAIEGDWPDTRRIDRFVRARGGDPDAPAALAGFKRFPQ